uniref:Transposable element P transposase n=1 Tax=Anopheles funestus TaxID=62324 RepID=A0A4Y0BDH9_ANOFN
MYDDNQITAKPLWKLLHARAEAEMTPIFKINKTHLKMSSLEKQNVRRAAQLLSRTTAITLRRYHQDDDSKNLADYIEKIDMWFNVSNSYSPKAKLEFKKSYIGSSCQKQALDDMSHLMLHSKIIGKPGMQTFQKSILMQITSLKMLFEDMKLKHNIKYLSTYKLNQDVLENFFSQLRQKGGTHDHPSPLNCMYRIRMMILGKSPSILHNQTDAEQRKNIEPDAYITSKGSIEDEMDENYDVDNEEFIAASFLSEAEIIPIFPDIVEMQKVNGLLSEDDSEILSSVSSTALDLKEQERDGLEYIMGYLGRKFNSKFPDLELGGYSLKLEHGYCQPPSFVQHLSVGGLFKPSMNFLAEGNKMEKIFLKLNPNGELSKKPSIVKRLSNQIHKQIKHLPLEIIKAFAKQRVIVRMRYLNMKALIEHKDKTVVRKRTQPQVLKTANKLRKLTR